MSRRAAIVPVLLVLLTLLAAPVAAQDGSSPPNEASPLPTSPTVTGGAALAPAPEPAVSAAPTLQPLPTAMPFADGALAQAVLFFSPTCPHCHKVITETLPPLFVEHGGEPTVTFDRSVPANAVSSYLMSNGRLQVLLIDVTQPDGQAMFQADTIRLGIDSAGVPRLDVGDDHLIGSGEIPAVFPGLVERALDGDGSTWPPVPGLDRALAPFIAEGAVPDLADSVPDEATEPGTGATDDGSELVAQDPFAVIPIGSAVDQSPLDKFGQDPLGNGVAVVVLILLLVSLVAAPLLAVRGSLPAFPSWLVIVLALVGAAVAGYLANVETNGYEAVCGPVGDCNAVQQSEYAQLFGIPIGVLGVAGYLAIAGLWLVSRVARGSLAEWALVLIALGALGGVAFSAYLTFLEPFVIGATCLWCITSAIVMMALLWISAGPAWAAWQRLRTAVGEPAAA